ncbi:ABC-type antimicrobial peptide transport system, permease component [Chitinophaga sp. YR573]|uniref:ABC transporter permease n=1 Tax=Chitinophaga sp. YR573 TaxID=1881040 RepID=UPI0008BF5B62|nr:ABC transporter permease [Chitinophaga sp. YR573]SEW44947.1 ABC-type antimicrobial peptide transport system, permease component [Chitinophaga sp. YR573]
MLKNYLKTAWRSLIKNKLSAFINIGGLSVGITVAMLIACWIYNEWSFDRQFDNYRRIAQVWEIWPEHKGTQRQLPVPVADELRTKFGSDFKRIVLSSQTQEHVLAFGQQKLIKAGNFIEPEGLEMLTLSMLQGSRSGLKDPYSILLSASLAKALFANADPLGQILRMDDSLSVKVTGIYADFPYNSTFSDITFLSPWDLYASFDAETRNNRHSWEDNNWQIFVQLADHADMAKVSAKIKTIKADNNPWSDSKGHNLNTTELFLHPMSRWHLYSEFRNGDSDTGRIRYVRLFGLIGAFVLLLACINFMNLSTARSEKRAREVGIRKAIGSLRSQLIGQFFSESLLVTILALGIALGLFQLSLPFFNELAGTKMIIPWSNPLWWIACIGFSLFTGLIAGCYPALYLSSFQPVKVLKGVSRGGRLASLPRKVLVVAQFTVSITMIIGTIIVFRQVQYARDRPVGYNREGLVMMQMHTTNIHDHFSAFRNDLQNTGAIAEVTESISPVTASWPFNGGLTWTGHSSAVPGDPDFAMKGVTQEYAKTVGLQFTDGRDFQTGPSGSDALTMILNESAVKYMGLKDPVGKTITWTGYKFTVIGVVKNMVMESPYELPIPAMFYLAPWTMSNVTIRINPQLSVHEALRRINPIFTRYSPAEPFDYKFVDDEYDAKFRGESRVGQLASLFTALAIFISCLGLFGLASFVAEQRTKEIGVRKILGASVFNLWKMLSKDFVLLIILSCLIAIPIAWWFLHQWLQQFAYRTEISWWIFAAAGIGAILITLMTVSYQSIKAALTNPVQSLRTE